MKKLLEAMTRRRRAGGLGALVILALIVLALGPLASGGQAAPVTRTYYVAADEVDWNYAPGGVLDGMGCIDPTDPLYPGSCASRQEMADVFIASAPDRIGSTYIKALYREYTSGGFTTLKSKDAHLGTLGPILRGAVGDTIRVVFKNNTRFPASMHPHGVFYLKNSEGAPYNDGTSGANKHDDAVLPGDTHEYIWPIPTRAGPGPNDPSSIMWQYHSHVDEVGDTNAGLIGPIIVTAAGKAKADGSPVGVDKEFVTMFTVFDENSSLYLDANVAKFAKSPSTINKNDPGFEESNLMHSINGFVFGNLPGLDMKVNQKVRWYLLGMGTEVDLHTPHWHGQTLVLNGLRVDVVDLLPASVRTADMVPDNPGTWVFHCHVNDHIMAGMVALFRVNP